MIEFALIVLVLSLAAGFFATAAVVRLRSLRARTFGALLIAAALPLIAVVASGLVMFESTHDFVVLAIVSGSTAVAVVAAIALLRGIAEPLESLNEAARQVAEGDLSARAAHTGLAETDELANTFNSMAESIESLFDARRQLVAWASHDLRTPLASMQAMLEAIEDGVSTSAEYLPAMRTQVARLSGLVDDLFELAMIDASALTLEYEDVRVGDLIVNCVSGFARDAEAAGVKLTTEISSPELVIACAPDKIERVVMNLLTNALRHTPSDGAVAITADGVDGDVRVTVNDSGRGLGNDESEHVFDHFFRGDAARSTPGAGLGLAIAKGLVEAHGGTIFAGNNDNGGAAFSFTLPLRGAAADAPPVTKRALA
ncbi:MAG: HAMP domain-containing sensor histidine kinase [Solirubrobacterales bacterium]